jgi:hypothetical protein
MNQIEWLHATGIVQLPDSIGESFLFCLSYEK